jgi:hypothetical protein
MIHVGLTRVHHVSLMRRMVNHAVSGDIFRPHGYSCQQRGQQKAS